MLKEKNMKAFITNYKVIIVAVLSVLATLTTLTATDIDDKLVASLKSFVESQE